LFAYYTKGIFSKQWKFWFKYRRWLKLVRDTSLGITEFHFLNRDGEVIDIGNKSEGPKVPVEIDGDEDEEDQ
jgi:ribonuclease G